MADQLNAIKAGRTYVNIHSSKYPAGEIRGTFLIVNGSQTFTPPAALAEYGFLVASFDSRSAGGRGKKFLDAIYLKLGMTEVDDQAAGELLRLLTVG